MYHFLWRTLTRYLVTCGSILGFEEFFPYFGLFFSHQQSNPKVVLVTVKLQHDYLFRPISKSQPSTQLLQKVYRIFLQYRIDKIST